MPRRPMSKGLLGINEIGIGIDKKGFEVYEQMDHLLHILPWIRAYDPLSC